MKKQIVIFLSTLVIAGQTIAQQKIIQLYDGPAPGSESWNWNEAVSDTNVWGVKLAYNVSKPTLTVFEPAPDKANGTAVIICPGGGFVGLGIDHEGSNVAKWLVEKGITCFVLKYRLIHILTTDPAAEFKARSGQKEWDSLSLATIPLSVADGRAAVLYLRKHAADFNLEPGRVGIMGFSAGGTVTAASIFNYSKENRPDFAAALYPFFPASWHGAVPNDAPPLFIAVANDDEYAPFSVDLYSQWHSSKHDAELHTYAKGGHGFGTRVQNLPVDKWIDRFGDWLDMRGLLKRK